MRRSTYESLLKELRRNNLKSFKEILDIEGLPQDDNYYDYDLLMQALRFSRKRMVSYLLKKRCRVNKQRHPKAGTDTPLHLAVKKFGWWSIVEKMLKLKARVTDVNVEGNTPLHLAFINDMSDKVINMLLEHYLNESTVDIHNKDNLGFMHIACMKGNNERSVKDFFDVGMSDIYSQVKSLSDSIYAGYSCLHFAVEAGNHEVANFLCQYEADVYAQDRYRSTPIHLALEKRDARMLDILFYYDSKYENYVNDLGVSHFMAACVGSQPEIVEQFISIALGIAKEDPRTSPQKMFNNRVRYIPSYQFAGYTALHFACEFGCLPTIEKLLILGNHFSLTTNKLSPLDLARKNNDEAVCDLLEKHCDICQSCKDVVANNNAMPETIVEIVKPTVDVKRVSDATSSKCVAVEKMIKANTVFSLSHDCVITFARTFLIDNFPCFVQKLTTKLIDFVMGSTQDYAFCGYFNCQPRKNSTNEN